jgi:hypothetical protein
MVATMTCDQDDQRIFFGDLGQLPDIYLSAVTLITSFRAGTWAAAFEHT